VQIVPPLGFSPTKGEAGVVACHEQQRLCSGLAAKVAANFKTTASPPLDYQWN